MRYYLPLLFMVIWAIIAGCVDSSITTKREYHPPVIEDNGAPVLSIVVLRVDAATNTDFETQAELRSKADLTLTEQLMGAAQEWWKQMVPTTPDNTLPPIVVTPVDPVEPTPENCVTQPYTKQISVDQVEQAAYIFPKTGPEYGPSLKVSFSDGQDGFFVADSGEMVIPFPGKWVKYQPGTWDAAPNIDSAEVYAARGTKPASVTICW